ncbi:Extracellular membrane CFEM domain protein [Rutstroemia sp. NJR-2017a BVV2]|nr:Extracellular membrane CFEM domain protein [Rutstroemia sp. NJR-2017a BVV2]
MSIMAIRSGTIITRVHQKRIGWQSFKDAPLDSNSFDQIFINMQYSAFGLLALVSLAAAQIPACATTCINDAVTSSTPCSVTDVACQCKSENTAKIQAAATSCVIANCPLDVAVGIPDAAAKACAALPASSAVASSSAVAPSTSVVASSSAAATQSVASSSASLAPTTVTSGVASPTGSINSTSSLLPYTGGGSQLRVGLGSVVVLGAAALAVF